MECPFHSFYVSTEEAKEIQRDLRGRVELSNTISFKDVEFIGGADVSFLTAVPDSSEVPAADYVHALDSAHSPERKQQAEMEPEPSVSALAVIVVLDAATGSLVETVHAQAPVYFPYIPGLLSFREGPAVLAALGKLKTFPGVMCYDGCGIAHPRGFGLASHMGILTGIPSVGCAKSRLCGTHDEPGWEKGNWTELRFKKKLVGSCLRTRDNVRPVFVSPGNGFSVDGARDFVMACVDKYRLPEPTRLAHKYVTALKKELITHT
ncbi:MAG: endonuclease V [Candidatus Latescibacteria bacterium]|nr:endonuclease V [Candidatus Latescibacterota bacterium]